MFSRHDCISVQKRGWKGIKNGALLNLAAVEFDLVVTSDQNIRYQQNLLGSKNRCFGTLNKMIFAASAATAMIQREITTMKPSEYRRIVIP